MFDFTLIETEGGTKEIAEQRLKTLRDVIVMLKSDDEALRTATAIAARYQHAGTTWNGLVAVLETIIEGIENAEPDLLDLTIKDLRVMVDERGLVIDSRANKATIVAEIREHDRLKDLEAANA